MDDRMDSLAREKEAVALIRQLKEFWMKAGMYPRKWISNSKKVLAEVDMEDRAKQTDLSIDDLPSMKTLGFVWFDFTDEFALWLMIQF